MMPDKTKKIGQNYVRDQCFFTSWNMVLGYNNFNLWCMNRYVLQKKQHNEGSMKHGPENS